MALIEDCCTSKSRSWRKLRRQARTFVSIILGRKSSAGSSVLTHHKIYTKLPNFAKAVMTSMDDSCRYKHLSWSKPRRWARTSVFTILERKSSAESSVLAKYKMMFQTTEFCQGSDDLDRWLPYVQALILNQAQKTSKHICFHHLGAEIIYWMISPGTVQMIYQLTEFRQGSDDFDRWPSYGPARILKQAKKTSRDIFPHHLGAEIICWKISPRTAGNDMITHQISPRWWWHWQMTIVRARPNLEARQEDE